VSRARLLALALLAPLLAAQSEPRLVPDVSQREIEIRYSFTGAELLLFGAILYPRGRVPSGQADIVVVLKGPVRAIVVREKQKVAGIWMNVENERFRSAPSFYAVASSRPLSELVEERIAGIYELGLRNLQLSPGAGATAEEQRPLRDRSDRAYAKAAALFREPARRGDHRRRAVPSSPVHSGPRASRGLYR
jgi:uncharacterized protein (TIGR02186 family)